MMIMNTTMAIVTSTMEVPVSSLKSTAAPFQSLRGGCGALLKQTKSLTKHRQMSFAG